MSCTVTVCRDCCCGTSRKHPEVDHDAQLSALRDGLEGHARLVVSPCLLACERSNVVVVAPDRGARGGGARPVWLDGVLAEEQTAAVVSWVRAGGPGRAALPEALTPLVGDRPALLPQSVSLH